MNKLNPTFSIINEEIDNSPIRNSRKIAAMTLPFEFNGKNGNLEFKGYGNWSSDAVVWSSLPSGSNTPIKFGSVKFHTTKCPRGNWAIPISLMDKLKANDSDKYASVGVIHPSQHKMLFDSDKKPFVDYIRQCEKNHYIVTEKYEINGKSFTAIYDDLGDGAGLQHLFRFTNPHLLSPEMQVAIVKAIRPHVDRIIELGDQVDLINEMINNLQDIEGKANHIRRRMDDLLKVFCK